MPCYSVGTPRSWVSCAEPVVDNSDCVFALASLEYEEPVATSQSQLLCAVLVLDDSDYIFALLSKQHEESVASSVEESHRRFESV